MRVSVMVGLVSVNAFFICYGFLGILVGVLDIIEYGDEIIHHLDLKNPEWAIIPKPIKIISILIIIIVIWPLSLIYDLDDY